MSDSPFDPGHHLDDPFDTSGDHNPGTFDPDHFFDPEHPFDSLNLPDWAQPANPDDPLLPADVLQPIDLLLPYDDPNLPFDPGNLFDEVPDSSHLPYEHFDPTTETYEIIGDPATDLTAWHQQVHSDTCAIVSQEFIIESLTGEHVSEDSLMHEAIDHGWYTPGGGTPTDQVGDLLEDHGIHVEREYGATLSDMADKLSHHQKVIVAVNGEDIWYHGTDSDPLASYPGIPGQSADHAVEVIGMDDANPTHPLVILNDPGTSDGRGIKIPADVFEQAWSSSDHFMMNTAGPTTSADASAGHRDQSAMRLGDAQNDADWAIWNAKNALYDASWAEYNAQRDIDNKR